MGRHYWTGLILFLATFSAQGFYLTPIGTSFQQHRAVFASFPLTALTAAASEKKRKRRRKDVPLETDQLIFPANEDAADDVILSDEDIQQLDEIANFEFKPDNNPANILLGLPNAAKETSVDSTVVPLPDIREARRKKQMEELSRMHEAEEKEERVRIKRSDNAALRDLLESQPFADADASYFEEEDYGVVSALLGEGAEPFLSIPPGPLQAGHFIGALGIVLMAFVQYPGFPLTNLPTPLRAALQGCLLSIYSINTALAVFATFKAGERGQSKFLWAVKTFSVGGLAFAQLQQLPTLDQMERAKAKKGKRALKNKATK